MEDDGFTLVTGKKSAKRGFKKTAAGTHIRVDGSIEDIAKSMESAKVGILKSGLGKWLIQKLESIVLPSQSINTIFLIGNGHFDRSDQPGAHQLALFLEISRFFDVEIVFQEPACSEAEFQWLREQKNLKIRTNHDTNLEIDENPENLTILAIIHGEHEIFQGILDFNWQKLEKSNNLIVIGNNYGGVDWALSKLSEENGRINEFFEKSGVSPFPEVYEPHSSAFSGTVVMSPIDNDNK